MSVLSAVNHEDMHDIERPRAKSSFTSDPPNIIYWTIEFEQEKEKEKQKEYKPKYDENNKVAAPYSGSIAGRDNVQTAESAAPGIASRSPRTTRPTTRMFKGRVKTEIRMGLLDGRFCSMGSQSSSQSEDNVGIGGSEHSFDIMDFSVYFRRRIR